MGTPGQIVEKMSQRVPLESRKQQVAEYLAKKGISTRAEIMRAVEIPNGSLSNVLADQTIFEQSPTGLWQLVGNPEPTEP